MNVSKGANLTAVWLAICFPTLMTAAYFIWFAGAAQEVFAVGKVIQFGFPLVWVFWVLREPRQWQPPRQAGLGLGLLFGLAVAGAMFALFHGVLQPTGAFAAAEPKIREKLAAMGVDTPANVAAMGVFYSVFHSLLEEYYWRWFIFRLLGRQVRVSLAVLISSLGFMAHHVVVLGTYFGWQSPLTYLFSGGVAVGGAVWAGIYHRSQSLYGPWLSHLLVDAAIFVIGYQLACP